jgi:hypothetical protein
VSHRTTLALAAVLVTATALIGCASAVAVGDSSNSRQADRATVAVAMPRTPRTTADGRTTLPPWNAPDDPASRVAAAGLPMLGAEGQTMHIHTHLDVLVNGRAVTVPGLIGIDERRDEISAVHTHDASGVIHMESPVVTSFTLGQFMTEWDVALDTHRLGGLTAGHGRDLRVYVNGRRVQGDPAAITLRDHDEIALVYGTSEAFKRVPSRYHWPSDQ